MKQEEKHIPAMVHAMIQVREKVKKLSAENEQLKAELDRCKLDQIEFLTEHPTYKLSKELEAENEQLKAKLEKAKEALKEYDKFPSPSDQVCCNNGVQVGEQEWACCNEPITLARAVLKEIEGEL